MILYAVTIFLSAFLLFQVQPVIAKMILPWFGGSSTVWNTCMVFFQAVLLLGYLYSHWVHEKLSAGKQAVVHTVLLAAGLVFLPIAPDASWRGAGFDDPSWQILKLLAATLGVPYFLLSATSPLLQAWYARTRESAVPYRLYALSNLASMLALLTYPVLFEPHLAVRSQTLLWSAAYVCFTLLCGMLAWLNARNPRPPLSTAAADAGAPAAAPSWGTRLLWVALAACASILLLAVTSYLTQDVAAVPFLWVLPLSIYLLSFIVCFEAPRLYYRPVYFPLLILALAAMGHILYWRETTIKIPAAIALCGGALFVFCMVCHGELARTKPAPRHLTAFYVMVSAGGVLGGLFVGIIAPNFFSASYELPAGLVLCACLAAIVLLRDGRKLFHAAWARRATTVAAILLVGVYAGALAQGVQEFLSDCRVVARNFYGQLRVYDVDMGDGSGDHRKLMHGVINHGEQVLSERYRRKPATYYCPGTGIGDLLAASGDSPRRIGLLGLGCGTLAAYGRPRDVFRIYEINPLVVQLARTEFTYLGDTPAHVETVLGDARLALEREPDQRFDLLIMDAFSGDSIPVHLVTREAFRTYQRHLKAGGIVAVNISNKYLDLRPVMASAARDLGRTALYFSFKPKDDDPVCFAAAWVLLVTPESRQRLSPLLKQGHALEASPNFRAWSDDYSGVFGILR